MLRLSSDLIRLFGMFILITIVSLAGVDKISADNPTPSIDSGTIDLEDERITEFDIEYGSTLLLDTYFGLQTNDDIEMLGHQFRKDIPYPTLATPWIWAAKLITFDNRCSQLIPLGDPHVIRGNQPNISGSDHEKEWGTLEHPVLLEIEITADPDMHELEIIDQKYNTVGKFDVAIILEEYCESNPDEEVCIQRKKKLIVLDVSKGTEDLESYLQEEFDQFHHLEKVEGLDGIDIKSGGSNGLLAVHLEKTSQSSPVFATTNEPFDESKRTVVYNGSNKLAQSNTNGGIKNPDKQVTIDLSAGVRGLAFTLGQITPDAVLNKDIAMAEASEKFDYYSEIGEAGELKNVAQSIKLTDETVANISVYGPSGDFIDNAQVNLLSVPGFHTFVGLITPNTLIYSVEIDYKGGTYEEALTDVLIIPEGIGKLPSKNFNRIEQPCPGFPIIAGPIADFKSTGELEGRHDIGQGLTVPPDDNARINIAKIKSYIDILVGRGYTIIAPDSVVDAAKKRATPAAASKKVVATRTPATPAPVPTKIVARPTVTVTPTPKVIINPTPVPHPTPTRPIVVEPKQQRNVLIRFFSSLFGRSDDADDRVGTFGRATGGTQGGTGTGSETSGGSCNLPGTGYEGLPLLAVLLIPAWWKYSHRRKK